MSKIARVLLVFKGEQFVAMMPPDSVLKPGYTGVLMIQESAYKQLLEALKIANERIKDLEEKLQAEDETEEDWGMG